MADFQEVSILIKDLYVTKIQIVKKLKTNLSLNKVHVQFILVLG